MSSKPKINPSPRPQATSTHAKESSVGKPPREETIRCRACEIYLERGEQPGRDLDDWLRAARELVRLTLAQASQEADSAT
jgi:hypothetical protein